MNGSSISKGIQEKIKTVYEGKGDEKMQEEIFKEYYKKKCHPSLKLSTNMGNIYTGSLYLCLMSLIADTNVDLVVSLSFLDFKSQEFIFIILLLRYNIIKQTHKILFTNRIKRS